MEDQNEKRVRKFSIFDAKLCFVWMAHTYIVRKVAVVLSSGGNQWLEMRGGAAMIVTPEIPFRIAQM